VAVLSVLQAAKDASDDIALILAGRAYSWRELAERVPFDLIDAHADAHADDGPMVLAPKLDLASICLIYGLIERQKPAVLLHPRLEEHERAAIAIGLEGHRHSIANEQCLAVLHTSGTTGKPKGAMLSRSAFIAAADASAGNLGWSDTGDDRWLLAMPLAHVGGLSILVRCLIARRCVVVPDVVDRFDPEHILDVIHRDRVTIASFVPTMMKRVLDLRRGPLPKHLRAILLGGAATPEPVLALARESKAPVLTTYGLTEACSQVTTQRYGTLPSIEEGSGSPMRGTEVRIAADGRIEARGPTMMTGYVGGEKLAREDWFRTEDFGRIDEEGRLHVLGRSQELIVTGGENVYPLEVERMLESLPGIAAACVFGIPDETWGEIVCAALVGDARAMNDLKVAAHKRPRRVAFLNELPMTAAGKLDRPATRLAATAHLLPWGMWR
jgi:o-succinylbenzoate---CoA ligase